MMFALISQISALIMGADDSSFESLRHNANDLARAAEQLAHHAHDFADSFAYFSAPVAQAVGLDPSLADPFVFRFAIFILAIFVGYYVVWQVTPALHTPLMSVTNAISSVIVVGAILATGVLSDGTAGGFFARVFGFIALILACVNIFGGFLVTERMLAMYKKKGQ